MKVIIPMAGRGNRLRPHTLTTPKPLIPLGGKPIVYRLVEDIASVCRDQIEEIGFVIGDFGVEVERQLIELAEKLGAKGKIFYQHEALGTGHAVLCAKELLKGPIVVAFADTLFKADFKIDPNVDGILWVKQIEDPSSFGVIKMNESGDIIDFVEKPQTLVSDLAMIGVYYIKSGEEFLTELNYLVDNAVIKSGEYQLPDALRRLTEKGKKFKPGKVDEWLDCGNKKVTVHTNQRVLEYDFAKNLKMQHETVRLNDSIIIPPCFIGENVVISNSIIGPHVSIGENSKIENSIIKNSILQKSTSIQNANFLNSMLGNFAKFNGIPRDISMSDYSTID
jgi:glucose-1-phosphate thymidylyltransferase